MAISLGELATRCGCELLGDPDVVVDRVSTLAGATDGSIGFFANEVYRDDLRKTRASAVILKAGDAGDCAVAALVAREPYVVFARVAELLHPAEKWPAGVHPSAVVDSSARVAATAHVAALSYVGRDSVVGDHAVVGPSCVVGDRCMLGDESRLVAGVVLVGDVRVGRRCIIHPGGIIGGDGFGNARSPTGWLKVPQLGGVTIGDDVEIGSNSTVDRGAIDDTVIGNGVRIDNLVQIAHNVRIGEHTAIASLVGIAGSATIGSRCMVAGMAGIAGHVTICDDAIIMGQAVISKSVTEPGVYSGAFAAMKDRDWKRQVARFRRLDSLQRRVEELERANKKDD